MIIRLINIQNKCLWVISKIYKIILIAVLEIKIYILFLNLHLNIKLAKFCQYHKQSEMKELVIKSCKWIQNKLQLQHNRLKFTVSKCQTQWAKCWLKSEKVKMSTKQALIYNVMRKFIYIIFIISYTILLLDFIILSHVQFWFWFQ